MATLSVALRSPSLLPSRRDHPREVGPLGFDSYDSRGVAVLERYLERVGSGLAPALQTNDLQANI